jgi:hypothetical protein
VRSSRATPWLVDHFPLFGSIHQASALSILSGETVERRQRSRTARNGREEEVVYACNACYSIRLVSRQRLPRERGDRLLYRMCEGQGIAELTAGERRVIF